MMLLKILISFAIFLSCANCDTTELIEHSDAPNNKDENVVLPNGKFEDEMVINETIAKYGFPINITELNLPGPELRLHDRADYNRVEQKEPGTYTLKIRTKTANFSYNGRYEESVLAKINGTEIPIVKGQFGEHFRRESAGYYIRTIGYTLDDKGYRQFLIDLSVSKTVTIVSPVLVGTLNTITTTVLESLLGGNTIG